MAGVLAATAAAIAINGGGGTPTTKVDINMSLKINIGISQRYGGLEITLVRSDLEQSTRIKKTWFSKVALNELLDALSQQNQNLQHLLDAIERDEDAGSITKAIASNKQVVCCVQQNTPVLKIQTIRSGSVQDGQTICVSKDEAEELLTKTVEIK